MAASSYTGQMLAEAVAAHRAGNLARAEQLYRSVVSTSPQKASAWNGLGLIEAGRGQFDAALDCFAMASAADPRDAEYLLNNGLALQRLSRHAEAVPVFQKLSQISPVDDRAPLSLGISLAEMGEVSAAVAQFDRAIALRPDNPGAHFNRAKALFEGGFSVEALTSIDRAIRLRNTDPQSLSVRGNILADLRRFDEAFACFDAAIEQMPDYAEAHLNRGVVSLLLGDLAAGWPEFHWIRKTPIAATRAFAEPVWDGSQDIAGKTVLIWYECGLGDTIQFSRYAALVASRGARVILEVQPRLRALLDGLAGANRIVARGDPILAFDFHCPIFDLPLIFAKAGEGIPASVPYVRASEALTAKWRKQIGDRGFRIGINWQGNPAMATDRTRSIPLAQFAPLAAIPGVRLISLQKLNGLAQLDEMPAGMTIERLGDDFDAGPDGFLDTAAVMASLDLVITADSSVAHLAGALARPTWIALRNVPDWRWGLDSADCPWYPTARLFRQTDPGNWGSVFAGMAAAVRASQ